jgi:hypothetical protein
MSEAKKIYTEKEMDAFFEKAEMDQLRQALKRTYAERFAMMTTLMKMNIMFRRAKITHKPFLPSTK